MKQYLFVSFAILAVLASAQLSPEDEEQVERDVEWYIKSTKGFWTGYMSGFYGKSTKLSSRCMDENTQQQLFEIFEFFDTGDVKLIFKFVTAAAGVINNFQECGFEEAFDDLTTFCNSHDCSGETILKNLQTRLFQVIDKINNLIAVLPEFPSDSADEVYEQTYNIGKDIGSLINYVYGYQG